MIVRIPSPLHSYTDRQSHVEAEGATIGALLADLDRRYPGIRFRIVDEQDHLRPYMRVFVNRVQRMALDTPLSPDDEVQILQGLAGG